MKRRSAIFCENPKRKRGIEHTRTDPSLTQVTRIQSGRVFETTSNLQERIMNKAIILTALCSLSAMTLATHASAEDDIKTAILKLFPQADSNGDGVLSDAEEKVVSQQAMKRHPQADTNGDDVLSDDEKRALLRMAANRAKNNSPGRSSAKRNSNGVGRVTSAPAPTHANVSYGEHERQVFDIWLADSSKPTPLAIYIHGGGFKSGSKEKLLRNDDLSRLLKSGISVASINYRLLTTHPLPTAHHDARRALQVMRSKANEWNIDKTRVAAFGGSAGAQICMWLAYSDEMAKPESADPIERESTRLTCVATAGGQTGNSREFWQEMIGPFLRDRQIESLATPLNGETDPQKIILAQWGASTLEEAKETASRHAALHIVSTDDPPIFMSYGMKPTDKPPTSPARLRGWLIHHVNLGLALKEKTDELNVEAHLKYPGAKVKYASLVEFFQDKLLK